MRASHARTLLPAALASVPFGFVLVRVRVRVVLIMPVQFRTISGLQVRILEIKTCGRAVETRQGIFPSKRTRAFYPHSAPPQLEVALLRTTTAVASAAIRIVEHAHGACVLGEFGVPAQRLSKRSRAAKHVRNVGDAGDVPSAQIYRNSEDFKREALKSNFIGTIHVFLLHSF